VPVRPRAPADLPGCVAALRRVHEASGYPSHWPDDPGRWITPSRMVAAWVAELDGSIAGHVALVRGMRLDCLLRATGLPAEALGGIARLYVDPAFQRRGLARALLEAAADGAVARDLRPVLDVVADARPAIALYEQAGWRLAGTQPATWVHPDGTTPTICCYMAPHPRPRKEPGRPLVPIDPERTAVPARPAAWAVPAGGVVYPYTARAPETGTLAPFTVSMRRPERQGA
jgi:GNAT superfamily N-acetyltransferase